MRTLRVTVEWDEEASVWVATNDDIGLATEADNMEVLIYKLQVMIPELIALNDGPFQGDDIPFEITSHRKLVAHARASA